VLLSLLFLLLPAVAIAQPVGHIRGRIVDAETGQPLAFTNVVLVGTEWGAMTDSDGRFVVENIPAGVYTVKASYIGYESQTLENVRVAPGETATADLRLTATVKELGEVTVTAEKKKLIDVKTSSVRADVSSEDLASLPVDEITEAIALKAGVVARGGALYVRGGRGGELDYQVDGVSVKDPLTGGAVQLATFGVEDTDVIIGGLDAKYGNAQSGVVNYKTKEGGDHVAGEIHFETDDFGAPDKTYNNYDRFMIGIGGPLPVRDMNYFASVQGTWADNYPATNERRGHTRVLDFISVGERKFNDVRLQSKMTWRPGVPYKLSFEYIANRTSQDQYWHNWTWEGYVRTFLDTLDIEGPNNVRELRGPWSPFKIDDSYSYYNAAEHTPDVDQVFNQAKFAFTHTLGEGNTFYAIKAARQHFSVDQSVSGKNPWEYDITEARDLYYDYENEEQSFFYVRGGDFPLWEHRDTKVYSGQLEVTHRWRKHTFETGASVKYNDLLFHHVERMYLFRDSGREIGVWDRYHYYQPEGAAYIQDRWEHEGMVLNVGLRYDAFSVGEQVDPAEVEERVKQQISPRIGIAYPISDRDVFSFHYGRYYQFPDRQYLYDNRFVFDTRVRGNPNLTNETTVSYQAAIQHLFSETVKGQFSVYFKDIFGLLSVEEVRTNNSANLVRQYVNRDYASSRGIEATLSRSFAGGFTGELSYTFGIATGVASDPDAANEQNFRYLPISEQPLSWDERHSFSASFTVQDPAGNWTLGGVWSIGSGFPYTPRERDTRDLEPELVNSRRLPTTSTLDLRAFKNYRVWGQPFRVFVDARNLLDTRNIIDLAPQNWPLAPGLDAYDYEIFFTETGHAGGAYLGQDITGDGREDWQPVDDPRVFAEGRAIRAGVSIAF
jgi:outer membrane receptor for ferrienterochelin and colicin